MAIQNFLSGGFYGKLGAVVGQRWRNKRTLRVYVIPANPRTPAQQTWRGEFRKCVENTQLAMMSNWNTEIFDNPDITQWQQRTSTATKIKNKPNRLDRLPLAPEGFITNVQILSVKHYLWNISNIPRLIYCELSGVPHIEQLGMFRSEILDPQKRDDIYFDVATVPEGWKGYLTNTDFGKTNELLSPFQRFVSIGYGLGADNIISPALESENVDIQNDFDKTPSDGYFCIQQSSAAGKYRFCVKSSGLSALGETIHGEGYLDAFTNNEKLHFSLADFDKWENFAADYVGFEFTPPHGSSLTPSTNWNVEVYEWAMKAGDKWFYTDGNINIKDER